MRPPRDNRSKQYFRIFIRVRARGRSTAILMGIAFITTMVKGIENG